MIRIKISQRIHIGEVPRSISSHFRKEMSVGHRPLLRTNVAVYQIGYMGRMDQWKDEDPDET